MAENPLLPNKRLKELHALMQRCRVLDRKQPGGLAREAMLAAATIHLVPGDILCGDHADATIRALAPPARGNELAKGKSVPMPDENALLPAGSRLTLCAAMARGLHASGSGGVVMAIATAGLADAAWPEALRFAQHAQVPLLLVCGDATGDRGSRSQNALTLPAVSAFAKKLKLPVLPVDGEDAVAVYRVVQECAGRARMGEGPAVIWCMLTPTSRPFSKGTRLGRSAQPIARLERYLAVRGLLPKKNAGS